VLIYINHQAKQLSGHWKTRNLPTLTHDLLVNILEVWDMALERIVIHSIQEGTILCVRQVKSKKEIDARPSDAIAIALRTNSPIWVMEEVVADASFPLTEMPMS